MLTNRIVMKLENSEKFVPGRTRVGMYYAPLRPDLINPSIRLISFSGAHSKLRAPWAQRYLLEYVAGFSMPSLGKTEREKLAKLCVTLDSAKRHRGGANFIVSKIVKISSNAYGVCLTRSDS